MPKSYRTHTRGRGKGKVYPVERWTGYEWEKAESLDPATCRCTHSRDRHDFGSPESTMGCFDCACNRFEYAREASGSEWPGRIRLGTAPVKWPHTGIASPSTRPFSGLFAHERPQHILGHEHVVTGKEHFSPNFKARGVTHGKVVPRDAPGKFTTGKKILDHPKPIWPRSRSGVSGPITEPAKGPIVKWPKTGIASKKRKLF